MTNQQAQDTITAVLTLVNEAQGHLLLLDNDNKHILAAVGLLADARDKLESLSANVNGAQL